MATPKGHFAPPPPRSGPDYALASSWLARPGNRATAPPPGCPSGVVTTTARTPRGDLLHPSDHLSRARPLERRARSGRRRRLSRAAVRPEPGERVQRRVATSGRRAIARRRSAPSCSRARMRPRRSTSPIATCSRRSTPSSPRSPRTTPIILAGHSQGALHLSRLLVDRRDALEGRLVAAYVVGWPLSVTRRPARDRPRAVHRRPTRRAACCRGRASPSPPMPSLVLDGWVGTEAAPPASSASATTCCAPTRSAARATARAAPRANLGTLVPSADLASATLAVGQVGARCDKGFLHDRRRDPRRSAPTSCRATITTSTIMPCSGARSAPMPSGGWRRSRG